MCLDTDRYCTSNPVVLVLFSWTFSGDCLGAFLSLSTCIANWGIPIQMHVSSDRPPLSNSCIVPRSSWERHDKSCFLSRVSDSRSHVSGINLSAHDAHIRISLPGAVNETCPKSSRHEYSKSSLPPESAKSTHPVRERPCHSAYVCTLSAAEHWGCYGRCCRSGIPDFVIVERESGRTSVECFHMRHC